MLVAAASRSGAQTQQAKNSCEGDCNCPEGGTSCPYAHLMGDPFADQ